MSLNRDVIATEEAPAAVGPYSQAVRVGDFVYTAGQIPLVPNTTRLVEGGIEAQTRQVMNNLAAVLTAAGTGLENVVKTTIFLTDMSDFGIVNQVYGSFFGSKAPARSTVQVAALPLNSMIEIEAVAILP